LVDTRIKKYI